MTPQLQMLVCAFWYPPPMWAVSSYMSQENVSAWRTWKAGKNRRRSGTRRIGTRRIGTRRIGTRRKEAASWAGGFGHTEPG